MLNSKILGGKKKTRVKLCKNMTRKSCKRNSKKCSWRKKSLRAKSSCVNKPNCNDFTSLSFDKWKKLSNLSDNYTKNIRIPDDTPFKKSEIKKIFIPLIQLLNYKITNEENKFKLLKMKNVYIIGTNGSVSSGKSTVAELLYSLFNSMSKYKNKVKLISTDSFIYPNKILKKKNIFDKKGFPISYNWDLLIKTIFDIRNNQQVEIPKYEQMISDIGDKKDLISKKISILIIDGINILNIKKLKHKNTNYKVLLSDYLDFSIYIDSNEKNLISFYLDRLKKKKKKSEKLKKMTDLELKNFGKKIWNDVNRINLYKYILPYKCRSDLILTKDNKHKIKKISYKL